MSPVPENETPLWQSSLTSLDEIWVSYPPPDVHFHLGSPDIWRVKVQEIPTDNKHSFQIGSGNCSIAGCQELIQIAIIPVSVIPSKYYDLYTCFLFDQTKDYCRKWPDEYGGCPYWSCQIHMLGVIGKLYSKNQPSSLVSTNHIQRKYVSIAQPLDI